MHFVEPGLDTPQVTTAQTAKSILPTDIIRHNGEPFPTAKYATFWARANKREGLTPIEIAPGQFVLRPIETVETAPPIQQALEIPAVAPETPQIQQIQPIQPQIPPVLSQDQLKGQAAISQRASAPIVPVATDGVQAAPTGSRGTVLDDPRLASNMESLPLMAQQAGWAEVGGKLLRDPVTGGAIGRTSWVPKEPWFQGKPEGVTEKTITSGVEKALRGEPLNKKERDSVLFLLDVIEQEQIDSSAEMLQDAEFEGVPFDANGLTDVASQMRALGFTEEEISRETDQKGNAPGQTQKDEPSGAPAGAQGSLSAENAQAQQPGEQRSRSESTGREAESQPVSQAVDLFGATPAAEQALADKKRAVDERLSGEAVPVGQGAGDLFSGKDKQADIADAKPAKETKPLRMDETVRPERAKPKLTPEFESLHPKAQEKFNAAWEAQDVAAMQEYLDPANKGLRAEFESRSEVKLPKTIGGTDQAVADYFAKEAKPEQPSIPKDDANVPETGISVAPTPSPEVTADEKMAAVADKLLAVADKLADKVDAFGQSAKVDKATESDRAAHTRKLAERVGAPQSLADELALATDSQRVEKALDTPGSKLQDIRTGKTVEVLEPAEAFGEGLDRRWAVLVRNAYGHKEYIPTAKLWVQSETREADQGPAMFSRAGDGPRVHGIPKAASKPILTFVNDSPLKAHADYKAAKAGDYEAAARLVRGLVKLENLEAARQQFGPGAVFVPAVAVEASGQNQIPRMLAEYYAAEIGASTSVGEIFQTSKAYHTGAGPMERLIARPMFGGAVEAGVKYVLVDDVTTMGGTLAEMAHHIQSGGGEVVGIVVLVNASRSATMTPSKTQVTVIERRYGDEIKQLFGIEPAALTRDEASYILGFRDVDALRNRAATAERQRSERLRARGIQGKVAPPDNLLSRGATALIQPRPRAGVFVSGLSLRDAKATVARITKGYKNLPPIQLHERVDQAPSALLEQIDKANAGSDVEGAFHNGEIHLFIENLVSEERLEHVLIEHEVTHYGLRGVFGKGVDPILNHVWLSNKSVRAEAVKLKAQLNLKSNVEAVEETMARMRNADLAKLKGWDRLKMFIRNWLADHGFTHLADRITKSLQAKHGEQGASDLFVADVVAKAREWARSGKQTKATSLYMGVTRLSDVEGESVTQGQQLFSRQPDESVYDPEWQQQLNAALDRYERGEMTRRDMIPLGVTPPVLRMLGFERLPLRMAQDVVPKATDDKHVVSMEQIRGVVAAIADPVAVFDSDSPTAPKGSLVVLTDMKDSEGSPIVVAVHRNQKDGSLDINRIGSVYGKSRRQVVGRWFERKLRYEDKQRSPVWRTWAGVQFPGHSNQQRGLGTRIRARHDLVNFIKKAGFSRAAEAGATPLISDATARQAVVSAFGEKATSVLEREGLLNFVNSPWDFPAEIHPLMRGTEEAVYWRGRSWIVKSASPTDIVTRVLHEIGEHHGLAAMLGDAKYTQLQKRVSFMNKARNAAVRDAWKAVIKAEPNIKEGSEKFIAEVIARVEQDQRVQKQTWWRQLLDAIKAFVIRHYTIPAGKITEDHVKTLLRASVMSAAREQGQPSFLPGEGVAASRDGLFSREGGATDQHGRPLGELLNLFDRNQIVQLYESSLPELRVYKNTQDQQVADRNQMIIEADDFLDEMRKLPAAERDSLAGIAHEATIEGVDPSAQYRETPAIEEMRRLADGLVKRKAESGLTEKQEKLLALAQSRLKDKPNIHARLQSEFSKLTTAGQGVFRNLRDAYIRSAEKLFVALEDRISRMAVSGDAKRSAIIELRQEFDRLKKSVYFPLARFGDNVVIGEKTVDGIQARAVEYHESKSKADKAAEKMRADGYEVKQTTRKEFSKEFAANKTVSAIVGKIKELSDLREGGLLDVNKQELSLLLDDINQALIQMLPDQSFRRHFAHRKNVPGYSADFIRAYADSMWKSANHIANLRHGDLVTQSITDMQKRIDGMRNADVSALQDVVNHLMKREEALRKPIAPVVALTGQVGFLAALGSISNFFVNLTQTPVLTFPFLGARYGYTKASFELKIGDNTMKKQYGLGTLFLLLVGIAMLGNYFTAEPEAPLTTAQIREKAIQKQFSPWDGSHYELTKAIKESMNDPGSYEHEKTVYVDKDWYLIVETTFRGKNAFGGVVKNKVRAKVGSLTGTVIEVLGTD